MPVTVGRRYDEIVTPRSKENTEFQRIVSPSVYTAMSNQDVDDLIKAVLSIATLQRT